MLEFAVKTNLICVFSSPVPRRSLKQEGVNFTVKIDKWQRSQIPSSLPHFTYLLETRCLLPTLWRSRGLKCFSALFRFRLALWRAVCAQVMPQLWHSLSRSRLAGVPVPHTHHVCTAPRPALPLLTSRTFLYCCLSLALGNHPAPSFFC